MRQINRTGDFIFCAALCKTTSGQEGRRSAHASTGAKTRLGVRQNTEPLPPAASVRHTAGTPLLLRVCRNRIHYRDAALRRGCWDKRSNSSHHQPAPAISIWLELQPSRSVVGTQQMLKLFYLSLDSLKLLSSLRDDAVITQSQVLRGSLSVWPCQDG